MEKILENFKKTMDLLVEDDHSIKIKLAKIEKLIKDGGTPGEISAAISAKERILQAYPDLFPQPKPTDTGWIERPKECTYQIVKKHVDCLACSTRECVFAVSYIGKIGKTDVDDVKAKVLKILNQWSNYSEKVKFGVITKINALKINPSENRILVYAS